MIRHHNSSAGATVFARSDRPTVGELSPIRFWAKDFGRRAVKQQVSGAIRIEGNCYEMLDCFVTG